MMLRLVPRVVLRQTKPLNQKVCRRAKVNRKPSISLFTPTTRCRCLHTSVIPQAAPRSYITAAVQGILASLFASQMEVTKDVGWMNRKNPNFEHSINLNSEYKEAVQAILDERQLPNWPEAAADYHVVFVGGLWSHFFTKAYKKSLQRLDKHGISNKKVLVTDTSLSVEANGERMVDILQQVIKEKPNKKLILLCHSKGSLDTLDALFRDPSLRNHIHVFITLQSPLGGSPVAGDYMSSTSDWRNFVDKAIISFMAGDYSGVKSLTYEARRKWFQEHPMQEIKIPFLCFASSAAERGLLFEELGTYMQATYSAASDGLVAQVDAIFPGSHFVTAEGMSHLGPVINDTYLSSIHPHIIIEALVYLSLCKLDPKKSSPPVIPL